MGMEEPGRTLVPPNPQCESMQPAWKCTAKAHSEGVLIWLPQEIAQRKAILGHQVERAPGSQNAAHLSEQTPLTTLRRLLLVACRAPFEDQIEKHNVHRFILKGKPAVVTAAREGGIANALLSASNRGELRLPLDSVKMPYSLGDDPRELTESGADLQDRLGPVEFQKAEKIRATLVGNVVHDSGFGSVDFVQGLTPPLLRSDPVELLKIPAYRVVFNRLSREETRDSVAHRVMEFAVVCDKVAALRSQPRPGHGTLKNGG